MKLGKKASEWMNRQPPVPKGFKCDFCTWCIDSFLGVDLKPACRRHDWYYHRGRIGAASTRMDRLMADRVFRWETFSVLFEKLPRFVCSLFANFRYRVVRFVAASAFQSDRKAPG